MGQISTLRGQPPVLSMPLSTFSLPGSFGADHTQFIDEIKLQAVHAIVTTGGPLG